ncbi:hypothetical protein BU25DRAFT_419108 [Macroventuria anomochaeta]|uniref:Uncharacterized protein n=1 Tax=Macroventuria anomochaeta TaxID=301207 RepID=A0ACB6S909_9PLEO|nr:uncharacterized protein BU25DRAFT_419108 [Macroventuria anomochaeta]KAF2630771.1 hypothetical protein BU25DRAFT_419108 [Macroventuria anomochaeta]
MARKGGRRVVAPEIDARMNSINDVQEMRVQTNALLRKDLGLKISDSLLILLSAQSQNAVQSRAIVSRQGQRREPAEKGHVRTACPLGAKLCRVCGRSNFRAMDLQRPIAGSCFAPAKRDMAVAKGEWLEDAGTVHRSTFALGELSSKAERVSTHPANRDPQVL